MFEKPSARKKPSISMGLGNSVEIDLDKIGKKKSDKVHESKLVRTNSEFQQGTFFANLIFN